LPHAHYDYSGHVVLITGAGSGIGRFTAQSFLSQGAKVVIAGIDRAPIEAAAEEMRKSIGSEVLALCTDVRDESQVQMMVDNTIEHFGRLDVLVNNAGIAQHGPLRKLSHENWRQDFALNMDAAFFCAQSAWPHLKASGRGAVINISSVAGVTGTMGVGGYSAAKAGLQMFTRVAAAEWGPHGIRVNAVACGMIATERAKASWAEAGLDVTQACQGFPLRRPGEMREIAGAVLFLASDDASYITGETLTVAGGPQIKGMDDID
jgi:NAD(P)-dependent dehydrogenase (short-subunit alcohol dehydrogenase family)